MSRFIFTVLCFTFFLSGYSQDMEGAPESDLQDSLKVYYLDQVVVNSSIKETNLLKNLPTSISVLSPKQIQNNRIESLPELSGYIPNFFIPSYGSKVSTPVYIRGIGARNGPQTVSMYVDDVPSFNTATFDFEFQDIQRVEVLRGAQGTLYGRNAIGGIVNVYTLSPLRQQGMNVEVGGGNYGQFSAKAATYNKLNNNLGLSVAGYYKKEDGYFTNDVTGEKADDFESAGARVKFEWLINSRLTAKLFSHFEFVSQNAFPYMNLETNRIENNDPASYDRNLLNNGLSLRYFGNRYSINYTAGFQYLNDNMKVDQDFSPLSIFTLNQYQKEHSLSQELTIKSESNSNFQWVVGAFGFINRNSVEAPVTIQEDGMAIIQNQMDRLAESNPNMPQIDFKNDHIDFPGIYDKPVSGIALFHQSTLNDLFGAEGLSATAGIRFDYEKTGIDIDAQSRGADVTVLSPHMPPGMPPIEMSLDSAFLESFSKSYLEILPKFALGYEVTDGTSLYLSASKGYKSGGYNEQTFYQVLQGSLMESIMSRPGTGGDEEIPLDEQMAYVPEISWTYELGGRSEMFNRKLSATLALFYMNVDNIQITRIVDQQGTVGRSVTNAGKSESKGIELGLRYNPIPHFTFFGEYGFTNAVLTNYSQEEQDFSGNYIPFAPQHTLSIGTGYIHEFGQEAFLDQAGINLQYSGAGKIYWTEDNEFYEPFFGLLNGSITFYKGNFGLELWGKNILNKKYDAFFFPSTDMTGKVNHLVQRGIPPRVGVSLKYNLTR